VRDPKNPRVVDFIPCPPGTRAFHIQTHEDLLLAVNAPSVWTMQEFQTEKAYFGSSPADKLKDQSRFTAGIRVYDISKPEKPQESGCMPVDGRGPPAVSWCAGRCAFASTLSADFTAPTFRCLAITTPRNTDAGSGCCLACLRRTGAARPPRSEGISYN